MRAPHLDDMLYAAGFLKGEMVGRYNFGRFEKLVLDDENPSAGAIRLGDDDRSFNPSGYYPTIDNLRIGSLSSAPTVPLGSGPSTNCVAVGTVNSKQATQYNIADDENKDCPIWVKANY